jgi:hypothetical protein
MSRHGRGGQWVISCEGQDQICCEHKRMALLIARKAAHAMTDRQNHAFVIRWERKATQVVPADTGHRLHKWP